MHDDDAVTAALRARFGDAPADVDWDALQSRIVAAGRFRLAGGGARGWRAPASRWARVAIPAGLAASLALAAGLVFGTEPGAGSDLAVEDVVAVAASAGLPDDPLSVTGQEAVLSTLLYPEE